MSCARSNSAERDCILFVRRLFTPESSGALGALSELITSNRARLLSGNTTWVVPCRQELFDPWNLKGSLQQLLTKSLSLLLLLPISQNRGFTNRPFEPDWPL